MIKEILSLLMWPAVILVSYQLSTRMVMRFDRKYRDKIEE